MQGSESRKAYESPAVVAIGSMAEKTEFWGWKHYLWQRKLDHWRSKKPSYPDEPEYS
ncbi:hypothetical protein [Franzmannia qiaohouensis]|uniref:Uncharacterized protein n=1 Tax=Franzmannia qiaohouensis TaxID=1329370 RepID=A0ABU1HIJ4_9GAMM|nr:hypothetical protein [Halomonas qiaohouensis]MDR5906848.1 hypothetical protein [Halomonas qiaohouensis]